jgi:Na+-driven multidrug efflux pump
MQMFFEVGLFTGAIWLGLLGTTSLAANQIALSLASLTLVCYGLECGCNDKREIRKDLWIM